MQPADTSKVHNCIPDEHYVQTLLAVSIFFFFSPSHSLYVRASETSFVCVCIAVIHH